jgi:hypothetical protein
MTSEEVAVWKKHVDDALWWRDPEAGMIEEVEKKRRTITGALKRSGLGEVRYDSEDAPRVLDALREKAYLENPDADFEKLLTFNPKNAMDQASKEATDIARSIMATTILSDMLEAQFGIDPTVEKSDNKASMVDKVADKFVGSYQGLMTAAETAGQQILEKILDKEIDNVKSS